MYSNCCSFSCKIFTDANHRNVSGNVSPRCTLSSQVGVGKCGRRSALFSRRCALHGKWLYRLIKVGLFISFFCTLMCFFYIRLIRQNTRHSRAKDKRATSRPKMPFYGLASRFTQPFRGLRACREGEDEERPGVGDEGGASAGTRRYILSWPKWGREEMATVWTQGRRGGGREGGREADGVQSEKWEWRRVTVLLKTLVCSTQRLVRRTDVIKIKSCAVSNFWWINVLTSTW